MNTVKAFAVVVNLDRTEGRGPHKILCLTTSYKAASDIVNSDEWIKNYAIQGIKGRECEHVKSIALPIFETVEEFNQAAESGLNHLFKRNP